MKENGSLSRRNCWFSGILTFITLLSAPLCHAQENYPSRVVHVIVPFPPGSILDGLTRIVADGLSRKWTQPVIVDNIAGSGGNIGTERFARSAPDGYTLLAASPGPFTINRLLFQHINYDASTFVPIAVMGTVPAVLVVRKNFPANTLREFIDYSRANPGRVTYGSQGVGTSAYLIAKLLESRAKIEMLHIPYRGSSPALTDIAAGQIDCIFDALSNAIPIVQSGNARILAITDIDRSTVLPDIPTVGETLPAFRATSWFALAAPAGASQVITARISTDVNQIISAPETSRRLQDIGLNPGHGTPDETATFILEEDAIWSKLIREIGLEPQ